MSVVEKDDSKSSKTRNATAPMNGDPVETVAETPLVGEEQPVVDKKEPKVVAKVDLNTVKVDVGSSAKKGDAFFVYDNGRYLATFGYEGGERVVLVALDNYLFRNTVHNFSVVPAPKDGETEA